MVSRYCHNFGMQHTIEARPTAKLSLRQRGHAPLRVTVGFVLLFGTLGLVVNYMYNHSMNPTLPHHTNYLAQAGRHVEALSAGIGSLSALGSTASGLGPALWLLAVAGAALVMFATRPAS
jgi:hypothetical protein